MQFQPVATQQGTSSASTLVFVLNAAALALRPFTIVRTHFSCHLGTDQTAALEQQSIAVGIAVVSTEAAAVGITAIPTPNTEAASSLWFVHQYAFADSSDLASNVRRGETWLMDSKAMRKVELGQDMVVVIEGGGLGSGQITSLGGRILVKLN